MTILAVALLSLSPSPHCPEPITRQSDSGLSYSYLQLGVGTLDDDGLAEALGISGEADLFQIGGSFELGESFFATVGIANAAYDVPAGTSLDQSVRQLGIGFHAALSDGLDGFATFSYVDAEVEVDVPSLGISESVSVDGTSIGAGLRMMGSDQLEISVGMSRTSYGDTDGIEFEDTTAFGFGAILNLTDRIGVGISYTSGDDVTSTLLGLRVYI